MAFPEDPLGLKAELRIGGAWVDVTGKAYSREPITTTCGMSAEGTRVDPSSCSLTLNNRDGRFAPRNPLSPYYGLLGRNTELRVTVPGAESYLNVDGSPTGVATTPDASALDIVGDLDVRAEVTTGWANRGNVDVLIGKWNPVGNQRSWYLRVQSGQLQLGWSTDGTSTFFAVNSMPALPDRAAVRATLDVNDGAGGLNVRMYWATSLSGTWTQFADLTSLGTTSIFNSTAPLSIGNYDGVNVPARFPFAGRGHRFEVRNGIGGTVVAAPDFRALTPGTSSFADTPGRTWTLNGTAEITNREYLFSGEVSSWPPQWAPSGRDVWVPIEGAGILRRLGQGRKPVDSTLRRRIPSAASLLAYWPMEEDTAATQAYSPLPGVSPLKLTGADWASNDELGGSSPLPALKNPAALKAVVPTTAAIGWQVEFVYNLPSMPVVQTEIIEVAIAGSAATRAIVYASTAGIRIEARDVEDGVLATALYADPDAIAAFFGRWNRLAVYTGNAGGGQTRLQATWRDVTTNIRYYAVTTYTGTQGRASSINCSWGASTEGMALGHLAAFTTPGTGAIGSPPATTIFEGADDGFAGESALARLGRLGVEEPRLGMLLIAGDTSAVSELMGPQRPGALLALLDESAEADGGILAERRDRLGLLYRDRHSLYNQPVALTLDYRAGELVPPLEPVEDDQHIRNDVSVTRTGGSEARVVVMDGPLSALPPEEGGVGIYDESATLNLATDEQPVQIAAWRTHLGTWDEARYPSVTVLLHRQPHLIPAVLALRIGDKIRITNPPPWVAPGPVDLHVQQISHTPLPRTWKVTFVCAPAGPWQVGVMDEGHADTAGTILNGAITATATSVPVTTSAGPRWIDSATYPTEFPFDVLCGGEVMRVTACTGTGTSQTFTVTRSINGITKSHPDDEPVSLATPSTVAL